MKKRSNSFFILPLLMLLLFACGRTPDNKGQNEREKAEKTIEHTSSEEAVGDSSRLMQLSKEIVELLDRKEYDKIAQYISEKGLVFSPYTYVDSSSVELSREAYLDALDSGEFFMWGLTDGKGDSIRVDIQKYIKSFVYDTNFVDADTITINEFIETGNTINNIEETFPDAEFVEYHFLGSELYSGMNWKSLILVFDKVNNRYFLRAFVHNEWTI